MEKPAAAQPAQSSQNTAIVLLHIEDFRGSIVRFCAGVFNVTEQKVLI
jgi:hypothetical protein